MNLTQLRTQVQKKLGLDTTVSGSEESLVDSWLNAGIVDVLMRTRCNVNCADMTFTAGTWKYTLPTSALSVLDMNVTSATDGQGNSIQRTTPAEILRMRNQSTSTGTRVTWYALNGNDLLMVYPTPAATDTLEIFYVPRPTAMSATGNDPSTETYGGVPSEYHHAIELYALGQGGEYTDHAPSQFGARFKAEYQAWLVDIRRAARRKGGRNAGRAVIGASRAYVPSNPSTDDSVW